MADESKMEWVAERVAGRDAVWLQDSDTNLMVINSVMVLDHITVERLRQVWHERVMQAEGGRIYARFRKRVVRHGRHWHWQAVANFDLAHHIVEIDRPDLRTREALEAYLGERASVPLPADRPLWRFELIQGFGDGGTAVITRVHHVMGDGMGMLPIIFSLMDVDDPATAQQQHKTRGTQGKMWLAALKAALVGAPLLVARALRHADRTLVHGQDLTGKKQVAWTPSIDLALIKEIKNRQQATVNDVLLTCVAGAFRRYAARRPDGHIDELRVSMPVNLRPPHEKPKMENKFAAVMLDLPVEIDEPRARLVETRRRMARLKRSVEPLVLFGAIEIMLKLLPQRASRALIDFYARKCTAVLSNVPGPQEPMSVGGSHLQSMLFWVPQRANIGLGISILSYAGEVRVGVIADTAVMPEPEAFISDISAELEHLDAVL